MGLATVIGTPPVVKWRPDTTADIASHVVARRTPHPAGCHTSPGRGGPTVEQSRATSPVGQGRSQPPCTPGSTRYEDEGREVRW